MQEAFLWKRFTDASINSYVGTSNELILDLRAEQNRLRLCDGSTAGGHVISGEVSPGVITPTITGPIDGLTNVSLTLTLSCSHFEGYDDELTPHTHASSRWQIGTDPLFITGIAVDSGNSAVDKLSYDLASHGVALKHNTLYYARVSHTTATGVTSSWSNSVSFTTWLGVSSTPAHTLQLNTATFDKFGYLVALSGDGQTLLVDGNYIGVPDTTRDGYVCVYRRTTDGWVLQKTLLSPNPNDDNSYGISAMRISYDGNTVVVTDRQFAGYSGIAYVYVYTNSTWVLQASLEAPDKAAGRYFGHSVAMSSDGNLLAVGDIYRNMDAINTGAGAVHIFERNAGIWTHVQYVVAQESNTKNDSFGYSVSVSEDKNTLLVGAYQDDEAASNAGAAYIFYRTGNQYLQHLKIKASDALANDNFGFNCVLSGNGKRAFINSRYADPTSSDSGAGYYFEKINTTWVQTYKLVGASNIVKRYGSRAAMSSDGSLLVTCGRQDVETAFNPPDVYVHAGNTLGKVSTINVAGLTPNDTFGFGIAMSDNGSVVAISAASVGGLGAGVSGKVYIYE